jgi:2-(1,2-epoxy-1,2-dihydrophenyl)acetyl-CoA isomerase
MKGYFAEDAETAVTIDADGWLHTGDIGVIDADGRIRITDRLKDMFIVGGFNAYPAEIERILDGHPAQGYRPDRRSRTDLLGSRAHGQLQGAPAGAHGLRTAHQRGGKSAQDGAAGVGGGGRPRGRGRSVMTSAYEPAEGLEVEVDGPLLQLTLNRPERRNSLTDSSIAALIRALERAATDEDLRVVLLSGAGGDFCGGFDLVARNTPSGSELRPRTGSIQRRMPTQANRLIPLLLELQLPVVCAVHGWAVGIGAQLAVAADFTVVADDAVFWYPFLRRGFTPDSGSTWLLPRVVGPARARELLMLDRRLSGAEAVEWGIAHLATEPEKVASAAQELAGRLAAGPTVALGLTKALLGAAPGRDLHRHLADEAYAMELSSRSPDFREGMRAFAERRGPDFGGR